MSSPLEKFKLLSESFREDPYPAYADLRKAGPIVFDPRIKAFIVAKYHPALTALKEPRLSANRVPVLMRNMTEEERLLMHDVASSLQHWALFQDPPTHTRLRALIVKAFTPTIVEKLKPRIESIANRLLDEAEKKGTFDLMHDFAFPLPMLVIAELLGVPDEGLEQIKSWSSDLAIFISSPLRDFGYAERAKTAVMQFNDYLSQVVAEREKKPRADLISGLITAREENGRLSTEELIATCSMLFFAGHETTSNLIGNGMLALFQDGESFEWLRGHPEKMGTAVEELLRFDSPVQNLGRFALEDFELLGQKIPKGTPVFVLTGSANRDPEVFTEPDRLNLSRVENRHLSFGIQTHFCVGATLARAEGQIAFRRLLDRFPHMRLAEETIEHTEAIALRGLKRLRISVR